MTFLDTVYLRSVSCRGFSCFIQGHLGPVRTVLPACVYHEIHSKFKDEEETVTGYEDEE